MKPTGKGVSPSRLLFGIHRQFVRLFGRPSCKRRNSIGLVKRYTRLIK
jgi:hypothetical protein